MHQQNYTPYRRVIIDTDGWVQRFRSLLPYLTEQVDQAFHEIMYHVVEAVRYRDKAMREIISMVKNLETNIDYSVLVKAEIVQTLKQLAMEIYFRAEEMKLYNNDGILMYTYSPHPDFSFEDLVLISIIQLRYNPSVPCYEPSTYWS